VAGGRLASGEGQPGRAAWAFTRPVRCKINAMRLLRAHRRSAAPAAGVCGAQHAAAAAQPSGQQRQRLSASCRRRRRRTSIDDGINRSLRCVLFHAVGVVACAAAMRHGAGCGTSGVWKGEGRRRRGCLKHDGRPLAAAGEQSLAAAATDDGVRRTLAPATRQAATLLGALLLQRSVAAACAWTDQGGWRASSLPRRAHAAADGCVDDAFCLWTQACARPAPSAPRPRAATGYAVGAVAPSSSTPSSCDGGARKSSPRTTQTKTCDTVDEARLITGPPPPPRLQATALAMMQHFRSLIFPPFLAFFSSRWGALSTRPPLARSPACCRPRALLRSGAAAAPPGAWGCVRVRGRRQRCASATPPRRAAAHENAKVPRSSVAPRSPCAPARACRSACAAGCA
jgi:hypothetical protein